MNDLRAYWENSRNYELIIKKLSSLSLLNLIILCPKILKTFIKKESVAYTIYFFLVSVILLLTWSTTSNQLSVSDFSALSQLFCISEGRGFIRKSSRLVSANSFTSATNISEDENLRTRFDPRAVHVGYVEQGKLMSQFLSVSKNPLSMIHTYIHSATVDVMWGTR